MNDVSRRKFLEQSMLATAAAIVPVTPTMAVASTRRSISPNEIIRVGVIGVRGRGRAHVGAFKKSPDTQVVAICDPDESVIEGAMNAVPTATYYRDIRKLLEDQSIDAISIATPNHWHSLAAIWALQAGKHVYVEKPISHNVLEGQKVVEAAKKYGKVVQHGTQARSNEATREAIAWLHEGGLGKISIARGLCYKRRESIGKVQGTQQPPTTLDYDLWTGPAQLLPLRRKQLHYDWHWVFNTGNGDIGNQGVHQMDIARWGLNKTEFPKSITSCGGRVGYDDDGETPNTLMTVYDYGDQQLIFEVRGLKTSEYKTAHVGVIFHCEHGYLVSTSGYGKVVAFDLDGNIIRTFEGDGNHFQNFIDAVKNEDPSGVNANALEGHRSAALCHLGNISYRLGMQRTLSEIDEMFGDNGAPSETFNRLKQHLIDNSLVPDETPFTFGSALRFNSKTQKFISGFGSNEANALLTRPGREPFIVPQQV
ncbi:MAG: Gfo/Idh/MocA family oxidoreductase [Planctomycetes bacterium]|nr:Gfo/Idh/MocA family oxidoreductase [Planctomycetota bacterium]